MSMRRSRPSVVAAATGLIACAAVLAGCAPASPTPAASASATLRAPTVAPTAAATTNPTDLAFDTDYPATLHAEWTDPFLANTEFTAASLDDGNGSWSYTDKTTGCTVGFYQGALTDLDASGDDRANSMAALAAILGGADGTVSAADVEANGTELPFPQAAGDATVSFWALSGDGDDGSTWANAARYFTAPGAVLFLGIQCPSGADAGDEIVRVFDDADLRVYVTGVAG